MFLTPASADPIACELSLVLPHMPTPMKAQTVIQIGRQFLPRSLDWQSFNEETFAPHVQLNNVSHALASLRPDALGEGASLAELSFAHYMKYFREIYGIAALEKHIADFIVSSSAALVMTNRQSGQVVSVEPQIQGLFTGQHSSLKVSEDLIKIYEIAGRRDVEVKVLRGLSTHPDSDFDPGAVSAPDADEIDFMLRASGYNSMSFHMDRLRIKLIAEQPAYRNDPSEEMSGEDSTLARSRAFGPYGLESIPPNLITPLRREDQQVMQLSRPRDEQKPE